MFHEDIMKEVLKLASLGGNLTIPNPLVGAMVLDQNNQIIGRGFHRKLGGAHAEIEALNDSRQDTNGGSIYVNLEPCSHYGRTPPCVDAIIKAGLKRVVIGARDSNPKVNGKTIRILQENNIEVIQDVLLEECIYLNRGFFKYINEDIPWVTLKLAVTLDGKIADFNGKSRYISGEDALILTHQLRAKSSAVMVGAKTYLADRSQLNVRLAVCNKQPTRIILDTNLLTLDVLACDYRSGNTIVFYSSNCSKPLLKLSNVEYIPIQSNSVNNQLNLTQVLQEIKNIEINYLFCEGGGNLASNLLRQGLIDEIYWIIAPYFLNDNLAINALNSSNQQELAKMLQLHKFSTINLGQDLLVHGFTASGLKYLN